MLGINEAIIHRVGQKIDVKYTYLTSVSIIQLMWKPWS